MKTQQISQQKQKHWILAVLSNDEYSSDEEIVTLFMQEGGLTEQEARAWVEKRDFYLKNIVLDDGTIYTPSAARKKVK